MKTNIFKCLLLLMSISLMSSTCSSDDDDFSSHNSNTQQIIQVITTAQSGDWRITSFVDSGQDETNNFSGYIFTFNSNGSLVASNGNNTQSGTWSVTNSSSSSSSSNDVDFNIFFNVSNTSDFEDLNDDWDIVTYNDNRIELIDVSGGNGGTDTLVFQKN